MAIPAMLVSDLHLGARHSVLNDERIPFVTPEGKPAEVRHGRAGREALCSALLTLAGGQPVERLVLLGDVVDLSHATFPDGLAQLDALLAEVRAAVSVREVVLVPGNHDRHWWQLQCEYDAFVAPLLSGVPPAGLEAFRRTTPATGRRDALLFRTPLAALGDVPLTVAYPDYEFSAGAKTVRCHHGHLFEEVYTLLGDLLLEATTDLRTLAARRGGPTARGRPALQAARTRFAESLTETLEGADAGSGALGPELLERLNAPLVNLDWLVLGQTGLLQGERIGRTFYGLLARAVDARGRERKELRDAFLGLGQVVGLAIQDRLLEPPSGLHHSFSNNPIKTAVIDEVLGRMLDGTFDREVDGEGLRDDVGRADDPSASPARGATIQDMGRGIFRYLERVAGRFPDVLVFGHTHVSGQAHGRLGRRAGEMSTVNTGAWVSSMRFPAPDSQIAVIAQDGAVRLESVDLASA